MSDYAAYCRAILQMPAVLIGDDNLLARQGLKHLLGQEIRGLIFAEAHTGDEAIAHLARRHWDIIIIEVAIPGKNGFEVLREIRREFPASRVLLWGFRRDPHHATRARQLKASGYISKNSGRAGILNAFKNVLAGKDYFGEEGDCAADFIPPRVALSSRERDVLAAVVSGKRVGQIARDLKLSPKTVSTYKRRIADKLELTTTAELVFYALDHLTSA